MMASRVGNPFQLILGANAGSWSEMSLLPACERQGRFTVVVLAALSTLEVAAHTLHGPFAIAASRLWCLHGCVAVTWLLWVFLQVTTRDLRCRQLWFLLPILLSVPLCFYNTRGFAALNSESLSELQHAFERLREPDWGYTGVFWQVYPSRSFLPNMVPTLVGGISPLAYRLGFSIPVFLGLLFFYSGLRRCFEGHRFAAALASLATTTVLTYPVVCSVTRTFEMAVSSLAFGLWAIGALLAWTHRPTALSALAAAWTVGILPATFTPGLALAGLIWLCLILWLLRCAMHQDRNGLLMVCAVVVYVTVVSGGMYHIRENAFRLKDTDLPTMVSNFKTAVAMVASIDQSFRNVFTPSILIVPTLLSVGYAVSGAGGPWPLLGVLWCFPVIWASVNMHGKVAPQLPFVLYRVIVIVPVLAYCMFRFGSWLTERFARAGNWGWRAAFLVAAIGLVLSALRTFRTLDVFDRPRQPLEAESVIQQMVDQLPDMGLTPFSNAVLVNRTGRYDLHRIAPLSWYFLPGWTRVAPDQPLFCDDPHDGRPGVVIVLPGDPLITARPERYTVTSRTLTVPLDSNGRTEVVRLLYLPRTSHSSRMRDPATG